MAVPSASRCSSVRASLCSGSKRSASERGTRSNAPASSSRFSFSAPRCRHTNAPRQRCLISGHAAYAKACGCAPARADSMASISRCEYACAKMVSLSGNANTPGRFFIVINGQVHGFSNQ
nr:MAG: hypothetical protein [Molluscum contagiosum virus]